MQNCCKKKKQYHAQGHAVSPHELRHSAWCSQPRHLLPCHKLCKLGRCRLNLGVKRLSLCPHTDVHGGREVSRAVHLLRVGVSPGLSGSAPVPGTGGDPDRRERSAPVVLGANCYSSQKMS